MDVSLYASFRLICSSFPATAIRRELEELFFFSEYFSVDSVVYLSNQKILYYKNITHLYTRLMSGELQIQIWPKSANLVSIVDPYVLTVGVIICPNPFLVLAER